MVAELPLQAARPHYLQYTVLPHPCGTLAHLHIPVHELHNGRLFVKPSDSDDITKSEPIDTKHLRHCDFVDASDFHFVNEKCIWLVLVPVT